MKEAVDWYPNAAAIASAAGTAVIPACRDGAKVATLLGDRQQRLGRLEGGASLGSHLFAQPIIDLNDYLHLITLVIALVRRLDRETVDSLTAYL